MVTEAARDCFVYHDEVVAASNVYQRLQRCVPNVAFRPRGLQINTPLNDTNYSRYWFAFDPSNTVSSTPWNFDLEEEKKECVAVSFLPSPLFLFICLLIWTQWDASGQDSKKLKRRYAPRREGKGRVYLLSPDSVSGYWREASNFYRTKHAAVRIFLFTLHRQQGTKFQFPEELS